MSTPTHGGARQGTPGKGYLNRTDLMNDRAPSGPNATPASGDAAPPMPVGGPIGADEIPNLDDPTGDARPLTDGLPYGPGASSVNSVPSRPMDPVRLRLMAALATGEGNLDIVRLIERLDAEGRW